MMSLPDQLVIKIMITRVNITSSSLSLSIRHAMRPIKLHPQLLRGAGCTINDLWDRDLDRYIGKKRVALGSDCGVVL